MGYTAGTLDLSILGASDSAVASIDKTVKSLNSLSRAITKINNTQFVLAGQKLEVLFNKISQATNSINTTNITNLASAAKSLSAISKIGNLEKMDFSKVASGFSQLTTAITPFIDKIKQAETSLNALYGILNKSSGTKTSNLLKSSKMGGGFGNFLVNTTKSFGNFTKRVSGSFAKLFNIGRATALLYTFRRLGRVMGDIVTKGSDFGETLNLWKVAMGDEFLPQATEFVNKLNEAYGISKQTLMNSQAIFKNMLGSLGQISEGAAYQLSEGITQMALDYASLYNVQFEDAMTKFQAALAGQVRPIRSVSGYDITENTLFQLYQQLGGEKTMRQLSRTEKQLLAIYAVFQQMGRSGATGDLERTINSFANQSRVMADSWKEVQTYAGLTVTRLLEQWGIMKYVNAVLIFMSRLFEGIATSLDTGLGESGDVFGDLENGVIDTTEAVEDLENALLDFDKFRALDQTNTVSDTLGIDETILNAMTEYDSILESATLESRELADNWLESLGFIDKNKDGVIDIKNGLTDVINKIPSVQTIISNFTTGFTEWVNTLSGEEIGSKITSLISGVLTDFTSLVEGLPWGTTGQKLGEAINGLSFGELIDKITTAIDSVFTGVWDLLVNLVITIDWQELFLEVFGSDTFNRIIQFLEAPWKALFGDGPNLPSNLISKTLNIIETNKKLGIQDELADSWWENLKKKIKDDWVKFTQPWKGYASGGLPDKGSMFVAGEAGAEMVYNMPSGQSGVANIAQIAQATYSGTMKALNDWWGGSGAKGDIPQLQEANATGMYQAVTGVARQYGKSWSKV